MDHAYGLRSKVFFTTAPADRLTMGVVDSTVGLAVHRPAYVGMSFRPPGCGALRD